MRLALIALQVSSPTSYAAFGLSKLRSEPAARGTHHPFVVRRPRLRDFRIRIRRDEDFGDIVEAPCIQAV
jgi:hypothetical protein